MLGGATGGGDLAYAVTVFFVCFLVTAFRWVAVLHLDSVPNKPFSSEFNVLSFLFHQCGKDFLFIFFLSFRGD